jgi:hypothetical protein
MAKRTRKRGSMVHDIVRGWLRRVMRREAERRPRLESQDAVRDKEREQRQQHDPDMSDYDEDIDAPDPDVKRDPDLTKE